MKICPRYPIPKSLSSGKGLTIASLQFFLCLMFVYSSVMGRVCRNMKICPRYPFFLCLMFVYSSVDGEGVQKYV